MKKLLYVFFGLLLMSSVTTAKEQGDVIQLVDSHPDRHVVTKGDTLWDISGLFLKSPWLWPEVWSVNPQIDNPHLIYPGDIIYLTYVDGKPKLVMKRGDGVIKLSPQVRYSDIAQAIPAIPLKAIKSFLSDNLVLQKDQLEMAPYVVAGVDDRILSGAGDRVYARGNLESSEHNFFGIYRPARIYQDPESEEVLGYESQSIGGAYLISTREDILTLRLKRTNEEVRVKDRVMETPEAPLQSVFHPSAPSFETSGRILAVLKGVEHIGQYDVIAINRGKREKMEPGHVLQVYKQGEAVKDPMTGERIELPSERAGLVMIFKVFDKVSYALVMQAENTIAVLDEVRTPR